MTWPERGIIKCHLRERVNALQRDTKLKLGFDQIYIKTLTIDQLVKHSILHG